MQSKFFPPSGHPLIFGHRGVVTDHQENTMAGFQKAIALGLDGVELDTFLTKDGELVVFHDLYTKRLTGVTGKITEMTWPEIQRLHIQPSLKVGRQLYEYAQPEKISRLEDVLAELRGKVLINIEMKAPRLNLQQRKTGIAVAQLLEKMHLQDEVFVTSFSLWSLFWLKLTHRPLEAGILYSPLVAKNPLLQRLAETRLLEKILDASLVSLNINLFKKQTIQRLHQQQLAVGAWTIFSQKYRHDRPKHAQRELEQINRLVQGGVDYLITDDPQKLRSHLQSLQPSKVPSPAGD
ncbi:glycerophosphodiester phosphodiesterase [Picosynechococcus sp. NKBG15041c]|uniref:glycerophosphodiester phosphodiesterase n=1 Tax=Picosynechococcus sp. NKBG15041c TaxID=1407650 RepID=UPI00040741FB|nr:glycerophosphodiester phosphodiesterase [Picosynechococcus sp. NKBG15041c]